MPTNPRNLIAWILLVAVTAGIVWSLTKTDLPPADFTFINPSEVKSLDPAVITGQPEGRINGAIFEGLLRYDPETLEPIPAVAERWEISNDGLVYTFYLRDNARWSNNTPVTSLDFLYSIRRFLDPRMGAEYSKLAWYITGAERYNRGGSGLEVGDKVEIELNLHEDAVNTLRGEIEYGTLVRVDKRGKDERTFVVQTPEGEMSFCPTDDQEAATHDPPQGCRWCRQVLFDFREVGIKAIDDLTLQLTLTHPTPYITSILAFYPMSPVNQACLEKYGEPAWRTKAENIVTNGAYKVAFRRIRDRIRLVKNEYHWDKEHAKLGVIDVLAMESITTALNMLMTDKADWITETPPPAMRIMMKEDPPRPDLNPQPFLSSYFFYFNTKRKPLDDVRVRQALSMALNRQEIASTLLPAGERPSYSLVPPGIPGYERQVCAPEDPDEARRLLAEAGYPEGRGFPRLDILYNSHESHQAIAELMRKQWQRELGISVSTRNEEWASYLASIQQMQYNIARRGWIADYKDPNTFLDMFLSYGEQNNCGFANVEYDKLVEDAAYELDPEKRMKLFERAERILMDELPILPVYSYVSKNMVKPYVRGFYNNSRDEHPLWALWIDHDLKGPNEFMQGAQ